MKSLAPQLGPRFDILEGLAAVHESDARGQQQIIVLLAGGGSAAVPVARCDVPRQPAIEPRDNGRIEGDAILAAGRQVWINDEALSHGCRGSQFSREIIAADKFTRVSFHAVLKFLVVG